MNLLEEVKKYEKKKIILPETMDERVLKSACYVLEHELVDLVLIGNKDEIINKYPILTKAEWYDPNDNIDYYINKLYSLRKDKGLTIEEAKRLIKNDYMYLACLLVLDKKADGIVSGAIHTSGETLRPALQLIKGKEELVSSFFIMEGNKDYIFADCGLVIEPSSSELAIISKQSIKSYQQLIGDNPKLAFLSFSTYDSGKHSSVDKVKLATEIAKKNNHDYIIDGPLQLDSAISPEVAKIKCPNSPIKGEANIFIFPDLNSGNIGYKLVERFGGFKAYGPLTQGLNYPVNDLSRGSSVEDIIGVILITSLQATKSMI
jgi:phosphate acetyltransferase